MTPQEAARSVETSIRSYYVRGMEITFQNQPLQIEEVWVDPKTSILHLALVTPPPAPDHPVP